MAKVRRRKTGISAEKREANAERRRVRKRRGFIISIAFMITGCAIAWQFSRTHSFVIVSGVSMEPTLKSGEVLYASKVTDLSVGDICVLKSPDDEERLVKRLVALHGDTVRMVGGVLYVNGELSPYQFEGCFDEYEYDVKEDEYYFLGDNRGVSADSRYWVNYATKEDILFRASFVLFPLHKLGKAV